MQPEGSAFNSKQLLDGILDRDTLFPARFLVRRLGFVEYSI